MRIILLLMLTVSVFLLSACRTREADLSVSTPVLKADASALEQTIVTAHLEQDMSTGKNIIWCATFQIAWNEAESLFGELLTLEGNPPMVGSLNKMIVEKDTIDDASFVAMSGTGSDDVIAKIKAELERKFPDGEPAQLLPDTLAAQEFLLYAYLFKNMEFEIPFEPTGRGYPLQFKGTPVQSFGVEDILSGPSKKYEMAKQVLIHDFINEDDFVIELKTKAVGDQLILAKVEPSATLEETVLSVLPRLLTGDTQPESMSEFDRFKVPISNFDITRQYREIENKKLTNPKAAEKNMTLTQALQTIRFKFDHKGAVLKSEAAIRGMLAGPPKMLIFDKPYLIMMKRTNADMPYFAMWVDNVEVLVKT